MLHPLRLRGRDGPPPGADHGLSRGAIFHHYRDKDALFLALAEQDAERMADVVAEQGLVQVMRELLADPGR